MARSVAVLFLFLVSSLPVVAEPLVEGWVRQSSGEPVEAAQVRVFDWTDLRRGVVAQATTDAAGYFALPLSSLGGSALPQKWTLGQNYPNPFNPSTLIPYQVPTAARVRLEVFNVLGQRVATLVDEERSAGVHTAVWDATDAAGRAVGAGVYFYRLRSAGQPTLTRRMVLLDGQAGQAAASVPQPMEPSPAAAAERVYGLAVTGEGLVTYVDAAFGVRAGMAPVEVVVEGVEGLPRGKALTGGVLGDVNGDGQVTLDDAMLVMTYSLDGSVELPANGDISLGDVNGDGQVTLDDAQLLLVYVGNPADPSLPAGIGQAVTAGIGQEVPISSGDRGADTWVAGTIRRLTTDGGSEPSWSPDGRHIAFADGGEIYVMGSDGSNPRRLTTDGGSEPSWSPDGRHIAFADGGEIYVMGSDGSNPRRLTTDGGSEPSWSPDGRHIAFVSNDGIYVMGSDGSNPRHLTNDSARARFPSWSPDGRHIAFVDMSYDGNDGIYVMDSDGTNPRRLTYGAAWRGIFDHYLSWSPDGRHIAFVSNRHATGNKISTEIYVMDLEAASGEDWFAGAIRRLTYNAARDGSPSWSPDGRHIAFASDRDGNAEIYVMGSDGSNPRRLTTDGGWSPSWSPDGRHIAFASNYAIYVMDSDGSNPRRLTSLTLDGGSPSWSPDGRHIAFVDNHNFSAEIHVMDSDGSNPRNLTNTWVNNWSPSWSPNGRHIAFVSDRDGNAEIYLTHSSTNAAYMVGPFNLTNTWVNDGFPSWSPDGRHIAFVSDRDGNDRIYVMDSDGTNPRRLTNDSARAWSLSWSPDGRHIAFVSDRDGNDEIYVMDLDDSPPTAIPLAVGASIEGYLSADSTSYFEVTVNNTGMLIASTTGSTDTYGSIEDSSGNVLDENDDGGEDSNFYVSAIVSPGTYYIRVRGYARGSSGVYTLTVNLALDNSRQARIAEKLFGLRLSEADSLTNYDYNNYMARPHDTGECDGYMGGHSGWDVQTKSVAGDKTADVTFYSLTSGEVTATGGKYGKIAVYNATDDKTTLYLHAREIFVSQGQTVNVGTPLGIQGNAGLVSDPSDTNTNEHVHVEVRDGWSEDASCGAGATKPPINIDPIDYLYEAVQAQ